MMRFTEGLSYSGGEILCYFRYVNAAFSRIIDNRQYHDRHVIVIHERINVSKLLHRLLSFLQLVIPLVAYKN